MSELSKKTEYIKRMMKRMKQLELNQMPTARDVAHMTKNRNKKGRRRRKQHQEQSNNRHGDISHNNRMRNIPEQNDVEEEEEEEYGIDIDHRRVEEEATRIELYRHATNQAKASQFVKVSYELFHGNENNYANPGNSNSSSTNASSSSSLEKKNYVTKHSFVRVLNIARSAGALLPDERDLKSLATRLSLDVCSKVGNVDVIDKMIDLERWALLYPGDATEILRWSCNMASAIDHM